MKLFQLVDPRFSWVMTVILGVSVIAIALIVERFIYFGKRRAKAARFFEKVKETFATGGIPEVLALVKNYDVPFAHIVRVAFENYNLPDEMIVELMESEILEQRTRMERFLGGLNTIGNVAPLLGLLGTVLGLINAFANIATSGSGGPAVVAKGVQEALYTTAFGLIVAVPTIWAYNYFAKKSTDLTDEMESFMRQLLKFISMSKGGSYENPQA
ncbi:MAG: MotA/TolQ/ExbB proton channel family protein [candidate division WOR-3 bacterium]|nr:MotA/TolQ/ExbB proton channel family protein [candidate division WOR-3 bacterium]